MFREFTYLLYNSIVNPKSIIESEHDNIKQSFLLFILSQVSIAISFMYSLPGRVMPFMIINIVVLFTLYFALLTIINTMIINTAAMFASDKKQKRNTTVFFASVFRASSIYILIMPMSLLFSFLNINAYRSIMYMFYFLISIYYFFIIIKTVKSNFEFRNNVAAFFITLTPIIISFFHFFIFIIFYSYILISIIIL